MVGKYIFSVDFGACLWFFFLFSIYFLFVHLTDLTTNQLNRFFIKYNNDWRSSLNLMIFCLTTRLLNTFEYIALCEDTIDWSTFCRCRLSFCIIFRNIKLAYYIGYGVCKACLLPNYSNVYCAVILTFIVPLSSCLLCCYPNVYFVAAASCTWGETVQRSG